MRAHSPVDFEPGNGIWANPQFPQKKGRLFLYATWGRSDDRNNSTSVFFRFMASEKMSNRSKIGSLEASRRLLEVRPLKKYDPKMIKNDQNQSKTKGKKSSFFWWKSGYAQIPLPGSKIYWPVACPNREFWLWPLLFTKEGAQRKFPTFGSRGRVGWRGEREGIH